MEPSLAVSLSRIVEDSPVIVLIMGIFWWMTWRTWRQERVEMAHERDLLVDELRQERAARASAHQEMIRASEQSTEAIKAIKEAVNELRRALDAKS